MMSLKKEYTKYIKKSMIFLVVYTFIFLVIYYTFEYSAPFFIGGIIALLINPISTRLKSRFNINKGISTILLSFVTVGLFIMLCVYVFMTSIDKILQLINSITSNYEYFNQAIDELNISVNLYIEQLDNVPSIDIRNLVNKYSEDIMKVVNQSLKKSTKILTSIPYIVVFTITLFMATYFIAKDIDKNEHRFYNMFEEPTKTKVRNMRCEIIKSAFGYIKAYVILMSLTFIVTIAVFRFLKIPYSMLLSLIAAILDLVPFLGIAVVYIPFVIYYWIINDKMAAIILMIVFLVLSIIREVLEPKLVSANIGISPLSTLIAIFVGIQVAGVAGVIYFLGLVIMHKILRKVDLI